MVRIESAAEVLRGAADRALGGVKYSEELVINYGGDCWRYPISECDFLPQRKKELLCDGLAEVLASAMERTCPLTLASRTNNAREMMRKSLIGTWPDGKLLPVVEFAGRIVWRAKLQKAMAIQFLGEKQEPELFLS